MLVVPEVNMAVTKKPRASAEPKRPLDGSPTLYTIREAATYLGVTERRMRRAVGFGEVAYVKVGKLVRFRREGLDAYIEAQRVPARGEGR